MMIITESQRDRFSVKNHHCFVFIINQLSEIMEITFFTVSNSSVRYNTTERKLVKQKERVDQIKETKK